MNIHYFITYVFSLHETPHEEFIFFSILACLPAIMANAEKMTNECLLNESLREMCFIPQWESHLGGVLGKARGPQSLCEMLQLVNGGPAIMNAGSSPGTAC
jgi:hypothetical protein